MNPQTLVFANLAQSTAAVDTGNVEAMGLPIPRLPIRKGRSLVMEFLSVDFYVTALNFAAGAFNLYDISITTNPALPLNMATALADPRAICHHYFGLQAAAAPTSVTEIPVHKHVDLTDEAGHGILVATDNIYAYLNTINTASHTLAATATITYRFKDVSLEEYIGIVQSQQ